MKKNFLISIIFILLIPLKSYADDRYEPEEIDSNVVRIVSQDDGSKWGTGIVIAPNKVLTAAHVILKGPNPIIYKGEHKGAKGEPYTIIEKRRHYQYYPFGERARQHDLAILTTKEEFPSYVRFGDPKFHLGKNLLQWVGYPFDLIESNGVVSQWKTQHTINGIPEFTNDDFALHVWTKAYGGQSGSGLIHTRFNEVMGVLSGGIDDKVVVFCLLTGNNYDFVKEQISGGGVMSDEEIKAIYRNRDLELNKMGDKGYLNGVSFNISPLQKYIKKYRITYEGVGEEKNGNFDVTVDSPEVNEKGKVYIDFSDYNNGEGISYEDVSRLNIEAITIDKRNILVYSANPIFPY